MGSSQLAVEFSIKLAMLYLFLALDIVINSSAELDDMEVEFGGEHMIIIMFGAQVLTEVLAFLALFLLACGSYLFRVGLLGILAADFKEVLLVHPVYLTSTIVIGAYRVTVLTSTECGEGAACVTSLWDEPLFYPLYVLHKLLAALFYLVVLQATRKLSKPKYYSRDYWVRQHHASLESS